MFFYTDVSQYKDNLLIRGYKNGKRFKDIVKYKPYLFVPSKTPTQYSNVKGQYLERIDFDNIWDARRFIKKYKDVSNFKIYGMDKFIYPYISDTFTGSIQYDADKIKIMYIDIEVDSQDGFPDIELANKHINAITFRIGNIRTVLGLKEFDKTLLTRIKDIENVFYYQFDTEEDLLRAFLKLWRASDPDVVTGWNIDLFDIPYIVRRLRIVLSDKEANSISPWGRLTERTITSRGKEYTVYFPVGIAILDYLQLYKKFTYSQRESYSLNYIAHTELGVAKVNTGMSLAELYKTNHQLFIEYNIVDVDLIVQLEDKLRLIELVYAMAYDAKVNYNDTLGTVLLWDVIIMNYLKDKNIYVDPVKRKPWVQYEGGYVKEPQIGLHHWVVSFDLISLYPHLIMQYNISPETYVKKIDVPEIEDIITGAEFPKVEGCSIAANGCCYVKDKYGFLPALMDLQFRLREEYKGRMKEAKKRLVEIEAELDNRGISYK